MFCVTSIWSIFQVPCWSLPAPLPEWLYLDSFCRNYFCCGIWNRFRISRRWLPNPALIVQEKRILLPAVQAEVWSFRLFLSVIPVPERERCLLPGRSCYLLRQHLHLPRSHRSGNQCRRQAGYYRFRVGRFLRSVRNWCFNGRLRSFSLHIAASAQWKQKDKG